MRNHERGRVVLRPIGGRDEIVVEQITLASRDAAETLISQIRTQIEMLWPQPKKAKKEAV
jgi:hypothetical protein